MFSTLALAAALSLAPAQNSGLDITNVRMTFGGEFGPTRPDDKLLPGEVVFLAYDIDNLKLDPEGKAQYSIGVEVTNSAGKAIYSQKPMAQEITLPLGGAKLPARAFVVLDPDQPKGIYKCKVTVTDLVTKTTKVVDKPFEVLDPTFSIVRLFTTSDPDGQLLCPMGGVTGQALWVHFLVVNFARDSTTKQPNVQTDIRVLDQTKKAVNEKPMEKITIRASADAKDLPHSVFIPLNRPGVFTVEIKTQCKVTGKKHEVSFTITVWPRNR